MMNKPFLNKIISTIILRKEEIYQHCLWVVSVIKCQYFHTHDYNILMVHYHNTYDSHLALPSVFFTSKTNQTVPC